MPSLMQQQTELDKLWPEEADEASPEEQRQYDRIVAGAHEHIWSERGGPAIEGMFEQGMRPRDVVATVAFSLLQKGIEVVRSPEDADSMFSEPSLKTVDVSDQQVSGGVKFHAGRAILESVIDFGEKTGHLKFDNDEDRGRFHEDTGQMVIDMYLEQAHARGEVDVEGAMDEMRQIARLDGYQLPEALARQTPVAAGVGQALDTPPPGPPDGMPLMGGQADGMG